MLELARPIFDFKELNSEINQDNVCEEPRKL